MTLEELFEKRLLIITGKGGVGKTTIALALAFLNARHKRRSIIALIDSVKKVSYFHGLRKKIGFSEKKLYKDVYAMSIDPNRALEEYLRLHFIRPFPLYAAVFKSRALQHFFEAAPGLKELITIGKVWHLGSLKTGGKNPRPKYNQVIFDAPATGHALPLLNLPQRVLQMVQKGPFRTHVEWVEEFLKDPEETVFITVTTPEEMAVKETVEIIEGARSIGIKHAFTIVNCVYPDIFYESDERIIEDMIRTDGMQRIMPALLFAKSHIQRVKIGRNHIEELRESGLNDLMFIQFKFKGDLMLEDIMDISSELEEQLR